MCVIVAPTPFPESRRKSFIYSSDFDHNGVLYYLGTNLNTSSWENPANRHLASTSWSSSPSGQTIANSICILDLSPSECETGGNLVQPWWVIDLTPAYRVQLTAYSLRDGSNSSDTMIRNFEFQGSNDAKTWTILDGHHVLDESIYQPLGTATWFPKRTAAYRYFRVLMLDRNAGGTFFLSLSGIELYGTLYGAW